MSVSSAQQTLQQVFGYSEFRTGQEDVINCALNQTDSLILMPTGGGKSLCYQIPAIMSNGVTIVISPLISLMKDQVDSLRANGIGAAYINSTLPRGEIFNIYNQMYTGEIKLVYVAPERLLRPEFIERLQQMQLALIAVDEAHCVSNWGHDFRPEYARLGILKQYFPQTPIMALTATADKATQNDIWQQLQLKDPMVQINSFDRPNIRYTLEEKFHPLQQVMKYLKEQENNSGIIYCTSRKRVDEVSAQLIGHGFSATAYHAGIEQETRLQAQESFLRDDVLIIVATVAFGMGINKPNVRFVIHYDIPKNIESYYQETGRAGRDGLPAEALMLFDPSDIPRVKRFFENIEDEHRRRVEEQRFAAMAAFAEAQTCRRQVLLNYFGEYNQTKCNNCDICLDPPKQFDGTVDAQKALSCVYRLNQRFGIGYTVEVLRGGQTQRVRDYGHDKLSTYGIGKEQSNEYWLSVIRQLIHHGYLSQDITQSSVLKLTEAARPVLKSEITLKLAVPRIRPASSKAAKKSTIKVTNYDKKLFGLLRNLRKKIADEEGMPPYIVFNDATLAEMAAHLPVSDHEMLAINGVGATKLSKYGHQFIGLIQQYS
ncbi:MAG: ATP-dependent DNA helicase RecQ [Phenylobacterium sp.]|jgi:ATP-dependent DNA helicase RecQ